MPESIKFLQANMGNSLSAMDSLLNHLNFNCYDAILLQEPYTVRSKLVGFDVHPYKYLLSRGALKPGSFSTIHGSAIIICNPNLVVLWRSDLCTQNNSVATI